MNGGAVAFWSYSHDDNRQSGGAILALAQAVANEYSLATGTEIEFFVDRTSIGWGDLWRHRIEGALDETTFLIPIITPRYLRRPECRKELLAFLGRSRSLGLEQLVLPVLYVPVDNLDEDSEDDAVRSIAVTQYEDWTELRVESLESSVCRGAVRSMVQRMMLLAAEVNAIQLSREAQQAEDMDLGVAELVEQLRGIGAELAELVDSRDVVFTLHDATFRTFDERLRRVRQSGPPAAEFAITHKFAVELLPLAEREAAMSAEILSKALQMDPLVSASVSAVRAHPEAIGALGVLEPTLQALEALAVHVNANQGRPDDGEFARDWWRSRNHHTKVARQLQGLITAVDEASIESGGVFVRWFTELVDLGAINVADFPALVRFRELRAHNLQHVTR